MGGVWHQYSLLLSLLLTCTPDGDTNSSGVNSLADADGVNSLADGFNWNALITLCQHIGNIM